MDQGTPIYDLLQEYCKEENIRLHMPGHNGGKGFMVEEFKAIGKLDVTEVPGIDDLHRPQEAIKVGQTLLARAYRAKESFFLVNGATSGIHSLFLSLGDGGKKVLVPRNAHKAFFGGMVLADIDPVYIPCKIVPELGLSLSVYSEDVINALCEHPDAEAVFLTSPSFYGTTCNIKEIAQQTGAKGKWLFVDEAHGGHFAFHPLYPRTALEDGADASVNGLHKTLPVLNQGGTVHLGKYTEKREDFFEAYSMVTTTSPSFPILASIDLARYFMVTEGRTYLDRALQLSQEYTKRINGIKGLKCYGGEEWTRLAEVNQADPLKLLVVLDGWEIDGIQLSYLLRSQYHIQVELEAPNLLLAMMSMFHEREDWERLYVALGALADKYYTAGKSQPRSVEIIPPDPQKALNPREAYFAAKTSIPLADSRGRVSGEMIAVYPPGIPCLLPGEIITPEIIDYLIYLREHRIRLQGSMHPAMEYIKVIDGE
jgi:arginine decarboxylase